MHITGDKNIIGSKLKHKLINTYFIGSVTTLSTTVPGGGFFGGNSPCLEWLINLVLIRFVTKINANGTEFGP